MKFSDKSQKYQQFMKKQNQNLSKAALVINNQKFNLKFNDKKESDNVQMSDTTRKDRLMMKLEMKAGQKRAQQNNSESRNQNYQTTSGFLPQYVNKFSGQFTSVNKTPWKFRNYGANGLLQSEHVQRLQTQKRNYSTTLRENTSALQSSSINNLLQKESKQRQSYEKLEQNNKHNYKQSEALFGNVETTHYQTNASESLVNFKNPTPQKSHNTGFNSTGKMPFLHRQNGESRKSHCEINYHQPKSKSNFSFRKSQKVYDIIDNLKSISAVKKLNMTNKKLSSSLDVILNNENKNNANQVTNFKSKLKFDTSIHQLDTELDTNFAKQHQQGPNVQEIEMQFAQTLGSWTQSGKTVKSNQAEKRQQIKMGSYKTPMESQLSVIQNIGNSFKKIPKLSRKKEQIIKSSYAIKIPFSQQHCQHKALDHHASQCSSNEHSPTKDADYSSYDEENSDCDKSHEHDHNQNDDYNKIRVTFNKNHQREHHKTPLTKRDAFKINQAQTINFHEMIGVSNDEIHVDKYLLKHDIPNMINFLDKQVINRKEDNIVEHAITELAQNTNIPREYIENDVKKHKKVRKYNKRKQEAENPDPEAYRLCSVNEIAKYGKKDYPILRSEEHEHEECNHNISEDDKIMLFMKGYEQFITYQTNLKKCETDKLARRAVFGKFHSNPFLQIMQEVHEDQARNPNNIQYEKIEKDMNFQTKKPMRMSNSAKKFLNGIHKSVADDIYEMRKRLESHNDGSSKDSFREEDNEFSQLSKAQLIKKLSQFKNMLPVSLEKKNHFTQEHFDKIQFLNLHKGKQDISIEQQNRNNQEIYRLQYIEDYIIDQIRQKQIPKEILNMKELTAEEARAKKTDVEHKDEQIQQSLFNVKEQSSQKLTMYTIYKKMLFVPHGVEASADEVGIQSINYDEKLDKDQTTFKERDETSAFYDLVQQNKAVASKETIFYQKSKWGSAAVQPYYKFIKTNKFKLQNKMLNMGYASAIADIIQNNEDINLHLLEIHFDECSMGDDEFAVILKSIGSSRYFQTSIQKISYTNNVIGAKSIKQLDKLLNNSSKHRAVKELSLLNVLHPNDATALSDLHLLSRCLIGKQLQQLKLQKMNLNDDKFVNNLCQFIEYNDILRNLKLSQCQLQPKQVLQIVQVLQVRESKLYELDLSGNILVSPKGLQSDLIIQEIVNCIIILISNPIGLQVLNLQGMGLKQHVLSLTDAVQNSQTLRMIDFSANQLNHLDEDYINKALNVEHSDFLQQQFFDNDKYFLKTWEKFNARHMYGYEEVVNDETQKARLINQSVMRELKKEKQIETSVQQGRMNEVGVIQNKPQESIVLKRDIFNSEFINNVIGQDLSETNNFNKPSQWRKCLKNEEEPQNCEYVMMILEKNNQMEEIRDQKVIDIFHKMYHLETLKEKQGNKKDTIRENPIIFGSITNWKPVQVLKAYQYVTALSSLGSNERDILNKFVFDSANYKVQTWFPLVYNALYSSLQSIVEEKQPMMVGLGIDSSGVNQKQFRRQSTMQQNLMKTSYIFATYAPPGRHSIFLYDPSDDVYYQKTIFVDVKSVVEQQKYWMDNFLPTQKVQETAIPKPMASTPYGFLSDCRQDILDISVMHSTTQKHKQAFHSIAKHYNGLCMLHQDILAQHNQHYPFICQSDLDQFFNNPETNYKTDYNKNFGCCDNLDESHTISNTGAMLNRPQFIASIMYQYYQLEESQQAKDNFEGYLIYLIKNKKDKQKITMPVEDLQFKKLIESNRLTLHKFMQDTCNIYGFPPKRAAQVLTNLLKGDLSVILNDNIIAKWYIQSKTIITNEHTDWSKCLKYSVSELLRLIYKISEYLLTQENHSSTDKAFLQKYETLFKESSYVKFKHILSIILKDNMIDPDEPEKKVKNKRKVKGKK